MMQSIKFDCQSLKKTPLAFIEKWGGEGAVEIYTARGIKIPPRIICTALEQLSSYA